MSWLDFANYFLSNQKLHAWSWINRTSLGNEFFWWGFFGFCVFLVFSFFVSVLHEANKSPTHRILVGNQREKTTFRSWFPFPFLFIWWQFCTVQILSGPKTFLHISSAFLIRNFLSFVFLPFLLSPILDWEFSFFSFRFLPLFDWKFSFLFFLLSPPLWLGISFLFFLLSPPLRLEIFLLLFCASEGKDWHSHPGSRFMVS